MSLALVCLLGLIITVLQIDWGPLSSLYTWDKKVNPIAEKYDASKRQGEICALEWDDLSLENKTITVNKAVQKIKGEIKINTPKTKSSIRTIRLCDECIRLLSELKANQIPKSKYIFPSTVTGEIRDTSAVTRRLHRIQDRAGVPRIRFHDLRHSFATLSLEQGMDIKTVSHMLGHTDAGFTMNTYMHVTDSMQENVANTMGNLLGGNATNS